MVAVGAVGATAISNDKGRDERKGRGDNDKLGNEVDGGVSLVIGGVSKGDGDRFRFSGLNGGGFEEIRMRIL